MEYFPLFFILVKSYIVFRWENSVIFDRLTGVSKVLLFLFVFNWMNSLFFSLFCFVYLLSAANVNTLLTAQSILSHKGQQQQQPIPTQAAVTINMKPKMSVASMQRDVQDKQQVAGSIAGQVQPNQTMVQQQAQQQLQHQQQQHQQQQMSVLPALQQQQQAVRLPQQQQQQHAGIQHVHQAIAQQPQQLQSVMQPQQIPNIQQPQLSLAQLPVSWSSLSSSLLSSTVSLSYLSFSSLHTKIWLLSGSCFVRLFGWQNLPLEQSNFKFVYM